MAEKTEELIADAEKLVDEAKADGMSSVAYSVLKRLIDALEAATRERDAALEAAAQGAAPVPSSGVDEEKLAEVIDYYFDIPSDRLELITRALCEAYTEGRLT